MKIIAAVDKNWAIGSNGDLLFKIPEDMDNFKKITTESGIVIMGRKTFESLKRKDGLPNRINWVITRDTDYQNKYPNIKVFNSMEEVIEKIVNIQAPGTTMIHRDNICIIGGGEIYKQFLPFCDEAIITVINSAYDNPDTFFPSNLDNDENWYKVSSKQGEQCLRIGLDYRFNRYINNKTMKRLFT
jgi:dihydrofolate reductase